ncbi:MAG: MMPL family transporter [Candidatus Nanopelagicales bacterium]|nr:MMPL family transporter [Candidatus Nanopelagicales bacterium]
MHTVHSTAKSSEQPLFYRLGAFVVRHRWPVLSAYLISLVLFGIFGVQVFGAMKSEGFNDPGSDSSRAAQILAEEFETRDPLLVLAIQTPTNPDVDAPAVQVLLDQVAGIDGVDGLISYWSTGGAEQFLGVDGRTAQVLVFGSEGIDRATVAAEIVESSTGLQGDLTVFAFGSEVVGNAFTEQISGDLVRAEIVAVPIITILLIFVFGSLVAAGLPFLVAGVTILGSFLVLFLVSRVTDVSVFSLNLVTGLGLALGIDYALLIINRFREELRQDASVSHSVAVTVATAGKTVFVSGAAVAIALASLLIFPQYFLRSFAYAGIAVSVLAVVGALTALPALLAILGRNVNRLKVRRGDLSPKDDGAWARIARFVMRYPWPVLLGTTALLLVMAAPALGAVFGQVDERALPADNPAAQAGQVLREQFPGNEALPYDIVLVQPSSAEDVQAYAEEVSLIPEIERVTTADSIIVDGVVVAANPDASTWSTKDATRLEAVSTVRPIDPAGAALVAQIRGLDAPAEEVLVGGVAATEADATSAVVDRVWIVALWLAIATLVILFLFTGSVLIPIKAVVLNLLGLAATLGALVWVFQGGHLTWLTGEYTQTGTIDISTLALIAVIAFALSMDYEVFMLSRIKEEHDAGKSTEEAVAMGLQRTGRIVTAAALLIAIVFASFLTSGATNIKQLGLGVTIAILLDATVVRALLVPSFMRIAGNANWWAPGPLKRLHARLGLREE